MTSSIYIPDLRPPKLVKQLGYEVILQQMQEQFNGYQPLLFDTYKQPVIAEAVLTTDEQGNRFFNIPANDMLGLFYLDLESDPINRQLQVLAYREMMKTQEINESALAVMVSYAEAEDLDNLAVFYGLTRHEGETDDYFRRRFILAFDRLTTAGSEDSYIAHGLDSHKDVKDVSIFSPAPTENVVTILSHVDGGVASSELLQIVGDYISAKKRRPNSEKVTFRGAEIIEYQVNAVITFNPGPSPDALLAQAERNVAAFVIENAMLGRDVTESALHAKMHVAGIPGVHEVTLDMGLPITVESHQCAVCTDININNGGNDV